MIVRDLRPPGHCERVSPRSALVIAPHFDDEVLGCGGLILDLIEAHQEVEVLFVSDGSGAGAVEEPAAYAARRRAESVAATKVLGVERLHYLDLPDGELHHHRGAIAEGVAERLLQSRPGILLLPGPLEITSDHQAVFGAVFDLLHPLRPETALHPVAVELAILLYEINHPAYPNLLVDVGSHLGRLERAMTEYESQQERHDYWAAGLGLRRYRTHTLPGDVRAAEAYHRLTLEDFVQTDRPGLITRLGGAPSVVEVSEGPQISIVVRTCERPDLLTEALASVASSSYRKLDVVLVVDGGGAAPVPVDFPFPVRRVDLAQRGGRSAAANAGVEAASGDYVAFLDDDDRVGRDHYTVLAGMVEGSDVRVAYSDAAVVAYELGRGSGWVEVERRLPYSRDFDADLLLVDNYIPLNTLVIDRALFSEAGVFDPDLPFFEDWDFLIRLASRVPFHHLARVTCEYRHFRGGGHILGQRPREHPDFLAMKQRVLDRYREKLTPDRLARIVDTLRREAVESGEEARSLRRDRDEARGELATLGDRYHRLHGEAVELRSEVPKLRDKLDEQEDHLRRTYAEIERLGRLVEEMRGTRAWRLHEWWQRRRR